MVTTTAHHSLVWEIYGKSTMSRVLECMVSAEDVYHRTQIQREYKESYSTKVRDAFKSQLLLIFESQSSSHSTPDLHDVDPTDRQNAIHRRE